MWLLDHTYLVMPVSKLVWKNHIFRKTRRIIQMLGDPRFDSALLLNLDE